MTFAEVVSCQLLSPCLSPKICTVHFAHTFLWLDRSPVSSSGQRSGFGMYLQCCFATRSSASTPRYSQSIRTPWYFSIAFLADSAATSNSNCAFTAVWKISGTCNKACEPCNALLILSLRTRTSSVRTTLPAQDASH